jgi:hypothetical protein
MTKISIDSTNAASSLDKMLKPSYQGVQNKTITKKMRQKQLRDSDVIDVINCRYHNNRMLSSFSYDWNQETADDIEEHLEEYSYIN